MAQKGIGDYIPYYWHHFAHWGLQPSKGQTFSNGYRAGVKNAATVFKDQYNLMEKGLRQTSSELNLSNAAKKIETLLNNFYAYLNGQPLTQIEMAGDFTANEYELVKQAIEQMITEKYPGAQIDWSTLKVLENGEDSSAIISALDQQTQKTLSKFSEIGQRQHTQKGAIFNRLKVLNDIYENIAKDLAANNVQEAKDFEAKLNQLNKEWISIKNNAQNFKQDRFGKTLLKTSQHQDFITQLQDLISSLKVGVVTQIAGDLAETVVAAISALATKKAVEVTDELVTDFINDISKYIVGDQRSSKQLQTDLFAVKLQGKIEAGKKVKKKPKSEDGKSQKIPTPWGYVNTNYTQDKVDVNFVFEEKNKSQFTIPTSVKNINKKSHSAISLQSGYSILSQIQEYQKFTSNYIAVKAQYDIEPKHRSDNLINMADNALKMTLAVRALQGGMQGIKKGETSFSKTDVAEILIVNDSSTRHFKVYSITDILNQMSAGVLKTGAALNVHYDGDLELKNEYSSQGAWDRISNLVWAMQDINYNISLPGGVLNKI